MQSVHPPICLLLMLLLIVNYDGLRLNIFDTIAKFELLASRKGILDRWKVLVAGCLLLDRARLILDNRCAIIVIHFVANFCWNCLHLALLWLIDVVTFVPTSRLIGHAILKETRS